MTSEPLFGFRISPAVRMAVIFLAGEGCGFALPEWSSLQAFGFACLAWFLVTACGWKIRHVFWPCLFCLGVLLAWHAEDVREGIERQARHMDSRPRAPCYTLHVDEEPYVRVARGGGRVFCFRSHLDVLPVNVTIPMSGDYPMPAYGETWQLRGYLAYLREGAGRFRARHLQVRLDPSCNKRLEPARGITAFCNRLAVFLERRLSRGLNGFPEIRDIVLAIVLGRRNALSREKRQTFAHAGTVHVFAISGLHVMLTAGLVLKLLSFLGAGHRMGAALAIPFVILYVLVTGARPSAIRAAMMAVICLTGIILRRRPDMSSALAVTAIIVFGISPQLLFDIGCLFSFTVMAAITAVLPIGGKMKEGHFADFCSGFRVSFAAWAAGIPISAMFFGTFTWIGLPANLLILPLAGLTVAFGLFGTGLSFLPGPIGPLFNLMSAGAAELMSLLSTAAAAIPCSSLKVPPWSACGCILWYVGMTAILIGYGYSKRHPTEGGGIR